MIAANTTCTIKSTPDVFKHLIGATVRATDQQGARGTGSQFFTETTWGIYGNADTGFVVEPKE